MECINGPEELPGSALLFRMDRSVAEDGFRKLGIACAAKAAEDGFARELKESWDLIDRKSVV